MTAAPWREHSPAAFDCFDRIEAAAAGVVAQEVLDPVRVAVASALAHPEELERSPVTLTADDPRASACVAFAEQFVVDVSGTTDEQRSALGAAMGADTFTFVQALYVVDVFQRGRMTLERIFDSPFGPAPAPVETDDLWPMFEEFMRVVALGTALDHVTTELVRLRGARAHNCRICQSRLSLKAVESAGDDALFAAEVDAADLTERQLAALALADAVIWQPSAIDDPLVTRVRAELSDAEIVEIVLDLVRNAANKIAVSLGGDEAVVTDGLEFYDVDATGDVFADVDRETVRAATSA